MTLTNIAKEKLLDHKLITKMAANLDISYTTMRRWIINGTEDLTKLRVVKELTKQTGLTQKQLFDFSHEDKILQ